VRGVETDEERRSRRFLEAITFEGLRIGPPNKKPKKPKRPKRPKYG